MRQVESLRGETTVLFVTHRLETAKVADRIAVLENGRVQGQGGYEELLEVNALVQSLAVDGGSTTEQRGSDNQYNTDEGVADEDR